LGGHTHLTFSCCVLMMSVSLRPCTSSSNTHLVGHMARIQHSQAGTEGMQCAGRGKGTYILMRGRNRSGWRATFSPATLAMALPLVFFLFIIYLFKSRNQVFNKGRKRKEQASWHNYNTTLIHDKIV
jgi:hypothetical protein